MVWKRRKLNTCLSSSISSSVIRFFNFWLLLLHDKGISEITKLSTLLKIFSVFSRYRLLFSSYWQPRSNIDFLGLNGRISCSSIHNQSLGDGQTLHILFFRRFRILLSSFLSAFSLSLYPFRILGVLWILKSLFIVGWVSISHFVGCSISKSISCVKLPILGKHFFSPMCSWWWHSFRWFVIAAIFSPFPPRLTLIWRPQRNHLRLIGKTSFVSLTT